MSHFHPWKFQHFVMIIIQIKSGFKNDLFLSELYLGFIYRGFYLSCLAK